MREITDSTAEELLTALQGRIYYNPLVTGYEIKDRFIAGNVIEKAERIEAWMGENPESERMPEVKQALEALKDAEPPRIAFEDLDFNFGERWIPTGVYAAYMSRLFDTEAVSYTHLVDIEDRETGEIIPSYISIDRKTNEITDIPASRVRIPERIGKTEITTQDVYKRQQ